MDIIATSKLGGGRDTYVFLKPLHGWNSNWIKNKQSKERFILRRTLYTKHIFPHLMIFFPSPNISFGFSQLSKKLREAGFKILPRCIIQDNGPWWPLLTSRSCTLTSITPIILSCPPGLSSSFVQQGLYFPVIYVFPLTRRLQFHLFSCSFLLDIYKPHFLFPRC